MLLYWRFENHFADEDPVLFKLQAALGDIAKDFCNHAPESMLICILIILQQSDYGMAYPAVLLNPQATH